jgi:tripartite-type tricarboxylate transporter receptor subunit TctC
MKPMNVRKMRQTIRGALAGGALAIGLLAGLAGCDTAGAQSVEGFYRGRTVTIVIGFGVGGGYDVGARVLARHFGKHIPGNPTVVAQNMPGAGSLRAANYLYNVAPKDGATLGVFARGMAMEPLIVPAIPNSIRATSPGSAAAPTKSASARPRHPPR